MDLLVLQKKGTQGWTHPTNKNQTRFVEVRRWKSTNDGSWYCQQLATVWLKMFRLWFDFWIIWVDSLWTWRVFLFLFFVSFTELYGKKSGKWPNFSTEISSYILANSHRTQKWRFGIWFSFPDRWFSGSILIFRGVSWFGTQMMDLNDKQSFLKEKTHWTETSWRHHTDT